MSKFKEPRIEWNSLAVAIYIDDVQEVTHLGNCGNRSFHRPRHHTVNALYIYNFAKMLYIYNFAKIKGPCDGQVTLVCQAKHLTCRALFDAKAMVVAARARRKTLRSCPDDG